MTAPAYVTLELCGNPSASNVGNVSLPEQFARSDEQSVQSYCRPTQIKGVCVRGGEGGVECSFTSTETVGLLGTGAQDGHLDFHTALEL